jgi:hypothetical protein
MSASGPMARSAVRSINEAFIAAAQKQHEARVKAGVAAPGEAADVFTLVPEYNEPRRFKTLADDLSRRGWTAGRIEKILGLQFRAAVYRGLELMTPSERDGGRGNEASCQFSVRAGRRWSSRRRRLLWGGFACGRRSFRRSAATHGAIGLGVAESWLLDLPIGLFALAIGVRVKRGNSRLRRVCIGVALIHAVPCQSSRPLFFSVCTALRDSIAAARHYNEARASAAPS